MIPLERGILGIDGIQTDPAAYDHFQVGAHVDQRLAHLRPAADNHPIVSRQHLGQFFRCDLEIGIHRQAGGAHALDRIRFGLVANKYFHGFLLRVELIISQKQKTGGYRHYFPWTLQGT